MIFSSSCLGLDKESIDQEGLGKEKDDLDLRPRASLVASTSGAYASNWDTKKGMVNVNVQPVLGPFENASREKSLWRSAICLATAVVQRRERHQYR